MKIDTARDDPAAQQTQHCKLKERLGIERRGRIMTKSVIIAKRKVT
jgi:hypothetical protein